MTENKNPTFLTRKDFFQIDECKCGKSPFRYQNVSKNQYIMKCAYVKEEFDIKTRKWVPAKKQPCDTYNVFCGERPVFQEVKNTLIKKAQQLPNKDSALEEKLKLLFRFVFVSRHTSTLDEINILVKNSLHRQPRKVYYFPSSDGHMRISHYEPLEEYRDRIFSEKIVDRGELPKPPKEKTGDFFNILDFLNIPRNKKVVTTKPVKRVVAPVIIKPVTSKFILVSDEEESEKDSDYESDNDSAYSGAEDIEAVDEAEASEESETDVIEEPEVIDDEAEEDYDDYASGGEDD